MSDRVHSELAKEKRGEWRSVWRPCVPNVLRPTFARSQGCNLAAMFEVMQEHFSREPPVYAKPKAPASPPPQGQPRRSESTQPDYSARPPPPVPGARPTSSPLSRSASILPGGNDDRPPLPVRPGMSSAFLPPAVSPATHPHLGIRTQPSSVIVPVSYTSSKLLHPLLISSRHCTVIIASTVRKTSWYS